MCLETWIDTLRRDINTRWHKKYFQPTKQSPVLHLWISIFLILMSSKIHIKNATSFLLDFTCCKIHMKYGVFIHMCHRVTCTPCTVRLSWLENAYLCPLLQLPILTHRVHQTDLILTRYQGSLVGLSMQDYKCLCAVVMICATLVNI